MATTKSSTSSVPLGLPLSRALDQNASLADLGRRLAQSNARYTAVCVHLPQPMRDQVRPGPLDDEGWSLLASNAAVAAKLRHLLPRLADTLREQGWPELPIRVHIRTR
ncbi:MAG: hypothetical protein V4792_04895 [Pseudomonadota bacterium]